MSGKQRKQARDQNALKHTTPSDVPQFFRLNIEVGDLAAAISFYTRLLGIQGRKQAGSRCYFNCGSVTLQVPDVSSVREPHPAAKALYFTVSDLDAAYERAGALKCVSREDVHDAPGGGIIVRPWGGGTLASSALGWKGQRRASIASIGIL